MSRQDDTQGLDPLQQIVPLGITNAVIIVDPQYTVAGMVKYVTGGSLIIMRSPGELNDGYSIGITVSGDSLLMGYSAGKFYLCDSSPFIYNGAARYYLAAVGATATCQIVRALGQGYQG